MVLRQISIAAITVLLSVAAMLAPFPVSAATAMTHTVNVSARQFAFEPAILQVQRGDSVRLRFESLDASHGLFIDGYGVNVQAEPGQSAEVTFVADQAGKFKIRCSVTCGPLHPFMMGELQVSPDWPLGRALAAMFITTAGALAFFWKRV